MEEQNREGWGEEREHRERKERTEIDRGKTEGQILKNHRGAGKRKAKEKHKKRQPARGEREGKREEIKDVPTTHTDTHTQVVCSVLHSSEKVLRAAGCEAPPVG